MAMSGPGQEPGQVPLPDEEMRDKNRVRVAEQSQSPQKVRRGEPAGQSVDQQLVTAELLRGLLADTQSAILAAQKVHMAEAIQGLERRQEHRFEGIEGRLTEHGDQIAGVHKTVADLQS